MGGAGKEVIIGGLIGGPFGAALGAGVQQQRENEKIARNSRREQETAMAQQTAALNTQIETQEKRRRSAMARAAMSLKGKYPESGGRSGTILTSPIGIAGAPSTAGKTLLGA